MVDEHQALGPAPLPAPPPQPQSDSRPLVDIMMILSRLGPHTQWIAQVPCARTMNPRGLYLTGGVTKRMAEWLLEEGSFLSSYYDKGRLSALLEKAPLSYAARLDVGGLGRYFA